jgi:hypothetical protein
MKKPNIIGDLTCLTMLRAHETPAGRESHPTTWQHGFNVSAKPAREMASRADGYLPSCQGRGRRAGFKLSQSAF